MDSRDLLVLVAGLRRTLEQGQNMPLNDGIRAVVDFIDQMSDNVRITQ
ncbi:hypothetical protein [Caballeronia sp. LZ043]|nr:hypothetical protein [Caballeronia sp. LZ043]MDR5826090.1 hypothetical protein [Caballeronia sp. LZ043]